MNRIILRFAIGTIAAFITVLVMWMGVIQWRFNHAMKETWQSPAAQVVLPLLDNIAAAANRRDSASQRQFVSNVAKLLDQPVAIAPIDEGNLLDAHRALLDEGKAALKLEPGNVHTYYVPLQDKRRMLVVGPIRAKSLLSPPALLGFLISVVTVLMLSGYLLARPLTRMMNALSATAGRIMGGDLSARIAGPRFFDRECAILVDSFNRLADHNQLLFEKQQHLFQAIAHEMRTPTARMRFKLEMLAMTTSEAKKEQLFQELDADLDELDSFVKELVVYNSLDDGSDLNKAAVPIASTLKREREALIHLIGERTVELLDCGDLSILAEQRLFARVVRNLLSNALRYTKSRVVVSCEPQGSFVLIHVDDDGPGVPEKDRIRIFEPFKRLEESRGKASGGLGLGLAIVRRIAQVHGATIEIADSPLGGARFSISWPRAENRQTGADA